jgi:hypothetical protein
MLREQHVVGGHTSRNGGAGNFRLKMRSVIELV